ncbi:hypothetical protein [Oceanirhabdus seepicola]|uniref:Uncharacterized protein n=1 Tax=Oceanirhabdus seepicola TaxID=2828781 RepID=A0A9J6P1M5_9CLOT|nr:hypothetical protein [Oceanirhabdus seepicola]MCM1989945.1 hypothetical protein [Oceanirhabdus seepicola]
MGLILSKMYCGAMNRYITKDGETMHNVIWYSDDNGQTYEILDYKKGNATKVESVIFNDINIPKGTTHIKVWIHAEALEDGDLDIELKDRMFGIKYKN